MAPLFDLLSAPEVLSAADLDTLAYFGVQAALIPLASTPEAEQRLATEGARLRRAGISPFFCVAPGAAATPGGLLETELQRLPRLLSIARSVALGPVELVGGGAGAAETYALERVVALATELRRPLIVRSAPRAEARSVRRLLSILRDGAIPPAQVLGLSLPRAAWVLFRECGHAIGLRLGSPVDGAALVETINRFGSERVLLFGEGSDFLALPKALGLLEAAAVPASVLRRVGFENALKFFGIAEL